MASSRFDQHRSPGRIRGIAAALLATLAGAAGPAPGAARAERLGTVSFEVSCAPAVRADFNRGVALLHDFWYEEARPQFERILASDPQCAMAHWGLALSGFHQIWERPDALTMAQAWRELEVANAAPPATERERAYLAALGEFFRPGPATYETRIAAYAAAAGRLHAQYPQDVDAAAFHALALIAAEAPDDTSLAREREALAILKPLWAQYPDHPGLVHYIIHACDNPVLAREGLAAARRYGSLAADGPHAVHMGGHIFARLGLWQEDIDANAASVAASRAAEARGENGWMDQFHSDDFLVYAYLQQGDDLHAREIARAAGEAIAHHESMPGMGSPDHYMAGMFPYYRAKLPVFIALETRDWKAASRLAPQPGAPPETQLQVYWARVIGAGHLHRTSQARQDVAAYDALIKEVSRGNQAYLAGSTAERVRHREILSWSAFADGRLEEALTHMRAAADLQDQVGQQEVDIPAREMLGDMLLESRRPEEALPALRRALELSPNRFDTLNLAGRAAEAAGDREAAGGFYRTLLRSTDSGAHSSRAELVHARAVAGSAPARSTDGAHTAAAPSATAAAPGAPPAPDPAWKIPEVIAFIGLKPGDRVADVVGGRLTAALAQAVGPTGKVYALETAEVVKAHPQALERMQQLAARAPNVEVSAVPVSSPLPAGLDAVFIRQNYHDLYDPFMGPADVPAFNRAVYAALKPGGVYVILDHAAAAGSGIEATNTLHRIDPQRVKADVLAAGFSLDAESPILANPADDRTKNVFDPSIRNHTDQFLYRFVKPRR